TGRRLRPARGRACLRSDGRLPPGQARRRVSERDPRVDAGIEALPDWQADIFRELREVIQEADPAIEETIKRTTQPYFVLDGNVCAFLAAKDHVNLFLYDGAMVPDPDHIITAGHENKTARQISFSRGDPIPRRPRP